MTKSSTPTWWPFARDAALFFGGLIGVAVELLNSVALGGQVDYGLLTLFGGMMGLPWTLHKDEGG